MTVQDVRDQMEYVRRAGLDRNSYESRDELDALRLRVLESIADGSAEDPREMARLVLDIDAIGFLVCPWCLS